VAAGFPIRGEYRLEAEFIGTTGAKSRRVFSFSIRENERRWLTLGAFVGGIFVAGVVAGRIFSAQPDALAMKFWMWPALLLLCGAATAKYSRAPEPYKRQYQAKLEIGSATIGSPVPIHWWLHPAGINGEASTKLTFTVVHLEKNKEVFALERIPVTGEFALDYQFTDGSEHRVTTVVETENGETVRQERTVAVAAAAPSLRTKLPALILFLAVIAAGLGVGRCSRRASRVKLS